MSAAIVCGSRKATDGVYVFDMLDRQRALLGFDEVIEGGADGIDSFASSWCASRGVKHTRVRAEWNKHGRAAGPIRNAAMLKRRPAVAIAFPGGIGTADMVRQAEVARVPVVHVPTRGDIDLGYLAEHAQYHPVHIGCGLYQGGAPPRGPLLHAVGVNALVLAASCEQPPREAFPGVRDVFHAPGDDNYFGAIDEAELKAWHGAARWAAERAAGGRSVLVTCLQGWNRSGIVVAMAYRYVTGCRGADAMERVKERNRNALQNPIFARYLASMSARTPIPALPR